MATGYHHFAGELNAFHKGRNRSQTTVCLPSPSPPKKRASSYYPATGPEIVDESNPDPFYLEHSLSDTASWGSLRRGIRDVRFSQEANQYFMLSSVNPNKELQFPPPPPPPPAREDTTRARANINRSTLSVVELEHQLGLQQAAGQPCGGQPFHYSKGSFSSVQTEATPELTPSSSFSSNYSGPLHNDTVIKTTELFPSSATQQTIINPGHQQVYPPASTPVNRSRTNLPTLPSTPKQDLPSRATPSNASSDTLIMPQGATYDSPSYRAKPLPSLPPAARNGTVYPSKRGPNPSGRAPIEPSMISSPCRINPVTLEPHTSHFDQALFIPANECPSPVPSPAPASPASHSFDRQEIAPSSFLRERPLTSTSDVYCEQSVWESDSDNDDSDPRSLSRKPMDTLKKVRSRVHLRVAKSAPKLQNASSQNQTPQALEKFPSMPDQPPSEDFCPYPVRAMAQARSHAFRPAAQQTLRLVAPSTTSLVRPRTPRSRGNSNQPRNNQPKNLDIDRTTAAAMQAKSRRRPRSDSPDTALDAEREKVRTLCREERSDRAIHHSLSLARPPLYKRVWDSLRVLGCHSDISPTRPGKSM